MARTYQSRPVDQEELARHTQSAAARVGQVGRITVYIQSDSLRVAAAVRKPARIEFFYFKSTGNCLVCFQRLANGRQPAVAHFVVGITECYRLCRRPLQRPC